MYNKNYFKCIISFIHYFLSLSWLIHDFCTFENLKVKFAKVQKCKTYVFLLTYIKEQTVIPSVGNCKPQITTPKMGVVLFGTAPIF